MSAGVGLADSGSGTISFAVTGDIQQALLYWEGANQGTDDYMATMDITVDGNDVTGFAIGGDTHYSGTNNTANGYVTVSYRADITDLLDDSGSYSLPIAGLDFSQENDGAGVLVIYDDGTKSVIEVRDGNDYAHIRPFGGNGDLQVTVPQTFTFDSASVDRTAILDLQVGSVADDTDPGLGERPNSIDVTVGTTTTTFTDELFSADDRLWDSWHGEVTVPKDATSLTIQLFSRDDDGEWNCGQIDNCPASMVWVAAGLSIEEEEEDGCYTSTPGFWCNRPGATDFVLGDGLEVCGLTLDNVDAATAGSAIEDLVFGKDQKLSSPQQLQLIRQCTAAALNFEASLLAEGSCEEASPGIGARYEECCVELCTSGASGPEISRSGCIEDLDYFNNEDFDGNELELPDTFPSSNGMGMPGYFPPGAADSSTCEEANGNGFINRVVVGSTTDRLSRTRTRRVRR